MSDEKQMKPHGFLSLGFLKSVEDWRRFIESIPGKTFDGVQIGTASAADAKAGNIAVTGAYGKAGEERKLYSAEMRGEIDAILAAQSGKVTELKAG